MSQKPVVSEQGHWILARMGKRVLRPGGKALTCKLVEEMEIGPQDTLVEFAPGIGLTAAYVLQKKPQSYIGVELDETAAANLQRTLKGDNVCIINTSAVCSGLEGCSADKVLGEAMLTMHADHRKAEIIQEAFRLLKPGGTYGIHELGMVPDEIEPEVKAELKRELAQSIKVNARPLTCGEWCALLEKEGFTVREVHTSPMLLLEHRRILEDEGPLGMLRIAFNVMTHPQARSRILNMRKVFRKHMDQMTAIAIIAQKPA